MKLVRREAGSPEHADRPLDNAGFGSAPSRMDYRDGAGRMGQKDWGAVCDGHRERDAALLSSVTVSRWGPQKAVPRGRMRKNRNAVDLRRDADTAGTSVRKQ